MESVVFFAAAILAVAGAAGVVLQRNPFYSVLSLVVHLLALATLFLLLNAEFLAAAQVIVYAGAVMVLFLFVIMLLDLREEERRRIRNWTGKVLIGTALFSVAVILWFVFGSMKSSPLDRNPVPGIEGATLPLGKLLFTQYLLPFEIVSVLLLVAMVGVVLLSKKDLR